jgi:hypothetical protein
MLFTFHGSACAIKLPAPNKAAPSIIAIYKPKIANVLNPPKSILNAKKYSSFLHPHSLQGLHASI